MIDAVLEADAAKGKLAGAAIGEDACTGRLIRFIGEFLWESRRERNGCMLDANAYRLGYQ
jgi:hypothetical protein